MHCQRPDKVDKGLNQTHGPELLTIEGRLLKRDAQISFATSKDEWAEIFKDINLQDLQDREAVLFSSRDAKHATQQAHPRGQSAPRSPQPRELAFILDSAVFIADTFQKMCSQLAF